VKVSWVIREGSRLGQRKGSSPIGLGGSGDHVLDEVSVSGGIDDGDHVSGGLELEEESEKRERDQQPLEWRNRGERRRNLASPSKEQCRW
jgi:hypothetical protein